MDPELGFVPAVKMQGTELIRASDGKLVGSVQGFWEWSASDLIENIHRGVFAEYLVALALGRTDGVRSSWDPYDLRTGDGITVEVKSCAYIQAWPQREHSAIRFSIGRRLRWIPETDELVGPKKRQAQVYVFCLLAHREQTSLDPLDLRQWEFYVLGTGTLDREVGDRERIGLGDLERLGARHVEFEELAEAVREEGGVGHGGEDLDSRAE